MLVQVARLALCRSHIGSVTLTLSLLPGAQLQDSAGCAQSGAYFELREAATWS